ncbi:putative secretion activating protein [Halobacteroides halobius DSM 5150]|uniref:Putative secretion activating protein n=1 Tax=Halobacteroides halobius (strain ATCC 35273 / DSM 5150 / MD-1) TaxID=748449 RepID=L0KD79_HALHC|nr:glycosyl hydrolase 108 family protein [Halobacteroides halobius]AGB42048.1 putative secretion activating protein [Halobacteroides halobius DSM 5150]
MRNRFKKILQEVLNYEGGYTDDEDDSGGPTKFGVTESTARRSDYKGDLKELTKKEATEIYYENYWANLKYNQIEDDRIALEVLDQAINFGPKTANQHLQRACNFLREEEIAVDGVVGPVTLQAVNDCAYKSELIKLLNILQGVKYIRIVEQDKSQKKFIRGWLKRVLIL